MAVLARSSVRDISLSIRQPTTHWVRFVLQAGSTSEVDRHAIPSAILRTTMSGPVRYAPGGLADQHLEFAPTHAVEHVGCLGLRRRVAHPLATTPALNRPARLNCHRGTYSCSRWLPLTNFQTIDKCVLSLAGGYQRLVSFPYHSLVTVPA